MHESAAGPVSAIVLAAGRAVRFGRDKRLEPIQNMPMFLRTALTLRSVVPDTLVVLGGADRQHETILKDNDIEAVLCEDAILGMGHSLAYGVSRRLRSAGWLIMPADMPYIQPQTIGSVVAAAARHVLAAPVYMGRRGHPVWFGQQYGPELRVLTGDLGARSLLKTHAAQLYLCPVTDAGCLRDIDRPEDLG